MIFHITALSTYALEMIQNEQEAAVHSVYRNTINILVNESLFAIQTKNTPISPISLITKLDSNDFEKLSLKPGQCVKLRCSKAKIYDLAPKNEIAHGIRHELYRKFTKIITQSQTGGFELIFQSSTKVDEDLILSIVETKIHAVHNLCLKNDFPAASQKLGELVGLGIGLTPSGDDFLCGILAGLHIQGKEYSEFAYYLRKNIRANLQRTNEISRAFLSCALEGHFSLAINELWKNPNTEDISKMFHNIGHSSGMDTLCGIYFLFFLME